MFAVFGIRKRMKPKMEFEQFTNSRYNKYMEHQLTRLEKARIGFKKTLIDGKELTNEEIIKLTESDPDFNNKIKVIDIPPNPKLYFRICESLIKYSTVFFA